MCLREGQVGREGGGRGGNFPSRDTLFYDDNLCGETILERASRPHDHARPTAHAR